MSIVVAVSEPEFAVIAADTRRPVSAGEFRDDLRKMTRLRRGFVAWSGAAMRWIRIRGTPIDELAEEIPRLRRSGVAWAESVERRRSADERAWQLAEDESRQPDGLPENVARRHFAQFTAVSLDRPDGVWLFRTHGPQPPEPVPSWVAFPGGDDATHDRIITRARERAGPPTGVAYGNAARAVAAIVDQAADIWTRVGGTVDVAVVDRKAGELRRGRAPAAELVDASDEELLERIRVPTLGDRLRRRLEAARWTARTAAEMKMT